MRSLHLILIAILAGAAHAGPPGLTSGIPAFLDTDGDGVISEAERQAFVEARREARGGGIPDWDSNGDGVIDAEEQQAAVAILRAKVDARRAELFASVAGDDGLLSFEEFAALHPFANIPQPTVRLLFDRLDANGDGEVTLEEFLNGVRGGPKGPPAASAPPAPNP